MTAVNDLRILTEMADEIERGGFVSLPMSLVRCISTQHGKATAKALVDAVRAVYAAKNEVNVLRDEVEHLRNDMDRASEEILRLERLVGK